MMRLNKRNPKFHLKLSGFLDRAKALVKTFYFFRLQLLGGNNLATNIQLFFYFQPFLFLFLYLCTMIIKSGSKYKVVSHKKTKSGKRRSFGTYNTKEAAKKRLRQIQAFKAK